MSKRSFLKSIGVVSGSTLVSRILGLIRDVALAATFGASVTLDAFLLAFTIPNLFRRFFGEGALSAVFIPEFTKSLENQGKEAAQKLASQTGSLLTIFLSFCTAIGIALCLASRYYFATEARTELALELTALMLPYVVLICLTAFLSALLHAVKHFFFPAFAPVALNIFWLLGIFVFAPLWGNTPEDWAYAMAVSVLFGGVLQVLLQCIGLRQNNISLFPTFYLYSRELKKIVISLATVILGIAAIQINVFLDWLIAWLCIPQTGALTVLYMANRLMQFPLALIGISIATVAFPVFSTHVARGEQEELKATLLNTLNLISFLAIPAAVGLVVLSTPIIAMIFEHQNFSEEDSIRTAYVLLVYSSGIAVFSLLQIVSRVFYSLDDNKTPVRVASICVLINLAMNLIFVQFLAEAGLALATVLSSIINVTLLLRVLCRRLELTLWPALLFAIRCLLCSIAMATVVIIVSNRFTSETTTVQILQVFASIIAGILVYFVTSLLLKTYVPLKAFLSRN